MVPAVVFHEWSREVDVHGEAVDHYGTECESSAMATDVDRERSTCLAENAERRAVLGGADGCGGEWSEVAFVEAEDG